jgi:polyhydroxyalkanoate synthase subunit PhaC
MDFQSMWADWAKQWPQAPGFAGANATSAPGMQDPISSAAWAPWAQALQQGAHSPLQFDADALQRIQQQYLHDMQTLWTANTSGSADDKTPEKRPDRRFAAPAWSQSPLSAFSAEHYALNTRTMMDMLGAVQADTKTKAKLQFAIEQWAAATAPSNFLALNPEAQQKAIDTKGESIGKGIHNLLEDMRKGHLSMTDESQFEIGRNVATTEGAVVFENALFQLIEYKPLTAKVHEKPFLVIPPCINKYYILDLQPANSLVRHLSAQGHRTFLVSWRNPDASMSNTTWDEYIEDGAIKAIAACASIAKTPSINALGFCVGGTILSTAMAVLAARKQKLVASATLLTTFLDFSDTGILDIFIDEQFVKYREMQFADGGLLKGQELASTFSFLRPNDLVWNYVVGNYLKGETPPPFDLLYWNCDSTNLPGPMYAWYLRNTYHENNFIKPGKAVVCGEKIDLRKIDIPVYIYGSREDHIVPIDAAYASTQVLPGKKRFVMGASGHIAGVINPPAAKKRSHWVGKDGAFPKTHAQWLQSAQEVPGSWWDDWCDWLKPHAGKLIASPKTYGNATHKVIEPAPGRYVKAKA